MEFEWNMHGTYLEDVWNLYGMFWTMHGICTECAGMFQSLYPSGAQTDTGGVSFVCVASASGNLACVGVELGGENG